MSSLTIDGTSAADISVDIQSAQLDSSGNFQFEVENGNTVMVDGAYQYVFDFFDQSIQAVDALKALNIAFEKADYTMEELIAADITQDGKVQAIDAFQVLNNAFNKDEAVSPEWVFIDNSFLAWANDNINDDEIEFEDKIYANSADWDQVIIIENVVTDTVLDMTAILVGDVDGSYGV